MFKCSTLLVKHKDVPTFKTQPNLQPSDQAKICDIQIFFIWKIFLRCLSNRAFCIQSHLSLYFHVIETGFQCISTKREPEFVKWQTQF